MAGRRHMESKEEIRSSFVIARSGVFFTVRRVYKPVGGKFLSERDAKIFIDKKVNEMYNKQIKSAMIRIKKIKDLKKRCKEYRKLCRIVGTL